MAKVETVDLNLLVALDALLAVGSVTAAARRLGLSTSAMSRTLTRLRAATGDPLLVRAGRGLVPTNHAAGLRDRVHELTREARAVLRPEPGPPDVTSFERTFTIRAGEGFVELFSSVLVARIAAEAPRVRVRFAPKPDKDPLPLREGFIDLEIGVVETTAPEMRTQVLFRDDLVGVARRGHALLARGGRGVTAARYAACKHVVASPRADFRGPVDDALARLGLTREILVVVPGFPDAMRIARRSDLIATLPRSSLGHALLRHHEGSRGLAVFEIPVATPRFAISAIWHPRVDADPAHRWLRGVVTSLCKAAYPGAASLRRLTPAS